MTQTITIEGHITPKGRPRFFMKDGRVRTYTPTDTATYESWVRMCWHEQGGQRYSDDAQLDVVITAAFPIPKSVSKAKRILMEQGKILPTKKPDCDNIAKSILDALNGIAYRDDSQVVSLTVQKFYGDAELVHMTIWDR